MTPLADGSLTRRFTQSAAWVMAARVLARSSGFVTLLVLARLLEPEAFGLVGFGLLVIGMLTAFSEVGLRSFLIQRSRRVRPLLGTAWAIMILRGATVSLILIAAAPWIAAAFAKPEAIGILRALALIPVIRSLNNIETVLLIRQLDFRRQFLIDVAPQLGMFVVGISLALLWRDVWALVLAHLGAAVAQCLTSHLVYRSWSRPRLSRRRARLMVGFGLLVFLGQLTEYFALRGGEWAVAGLLDNHALGLYMLAFSICSLPSTDLIRPLGQLMIATVALVRDQPARLASAFLRSHGMLVAAAAPLCLGLILVADDFALVVLGPQWMAIAPLIRIAGVAAFAYALSAAGLGLFLGLGRPEVTLAIGLVGLLTLTLALGGYLLTVPPEARTVIGLALCAVAAQVAQHLVRLGWTLRLLQIGPGRLAGALLPTASALALMALGVFVLRVGLAPGAVRLVATVAAGGLLYGVCLLLFWALGQRGPLADTTAVLAQMRRRAA
jgi:lipopolysaccharide exporter